MSILPKDGRIIMILEPVSGRFGVHKLMAQLSSNALGTNWNGIEPITMVTFNKNRTRCKIISVDSHGVTYCVRILNVGTFDVTLAEGLSPRGINRTVLERLMLDGSYNISQI